ncbi:MAG: glycosyltransferase family 9 protein [Bacteroidota bacterium]
MGNSDNYTKQNGINKRNSRIIISRTDNIGDVVLALPMAGAIKKAIPGAYIIFLGKAYTKDIVSLSKNIDEFADWEQIKALPKAEQINCFKNFCADYIVHAFPQAEIARLAKKAGIRKRIGTTGRTYHWSTCNKLIAFSRRRSKLHEAQLNIKLLRALGINRYFSQADIIKCYNLVAPNVLPDVYRNMIDNTRFNLLLHPKSKGSAREWNIKNYAELINILPTDKFNIFVSGTEAERDFIDEHLASHPNFTNLAGKLTLEQFISFIANADGMVACSTGPLHIAAALGKFAFGIYPPIKPMHPARWAPLGVNAWFLVSPTKCNKCRTGAHCECIDSITPHMVKAKLMEVFSTESSDVHIH